MAGTVMDLLIQAHKRQQDAPPPKKRNKITPKHEPTSTPVPSQKRRVIALGKRSARLSKLPDLPLDILLEIFGHLAPLDLLHLSRTSKDLRKLLLHKSATSTWRGVFTNVTNIECPNDVTYPAWASLIWDRDCHACGTPNSRTMNFILRVRLCRRCSKHSLFDLHGWKEPKAVKDLTRECIPFATWGSTYREVCLPSMKDEFQKQMNSLDKEAQATYIRQRKEALEKRTKNAALWEAWSDSLQNERQKELDDIREKRSEALEKKLRAEGYDAELKRLDGIQSSWSKNFPLWDNHPLVKQTRPLTDRNWDQIKGEMISYMELVKADRIRDERRQLVWKRRDLATETWLSYRSEYHPPGSLLPSPIDFWFFDPVRQLIESPSSVEVSFDSLNMYAISGFVNKWTEEKMSELCRLLRFSRDFWYAQPADLKRAVCVVTCSHEDFHHRFSDKLWPEGHYPCMWFPEFLHHPCNALDWQSSDSDTDYLKTKPGEDEATRIDRDVRTGASLRVEVEFPRQWWRRRQWSTKWLSYDEKAAKTVRNILDACSLDRMATVEEVDQADPRIICLKCSFGAKPDGERRFPVLTWRGAVQHNMKKHWGDGGVAWHALPEDEAARARELEKGEHTRRGVQKIKQRPWRCGACKDMPQDLGCMSLERLRQHFDEKHPSNKDFEAGVDYYEAQDMPPRQPLMVQMIPKPFVEQTQDDS
ncbi:hypothetical protein VNI00_004537 [Paramarasmius palmivorus]|uniref:F-box domain-containing protein n=1 Tax=Paramarasmius palmivorus TaxID=297713 RepID=A0AAW0DI86_9AGAR